MMTITAKSGIIGVFRAEIVDYRVPKEQEYRVITSSPEFPGDIEGMEALRNWVRNQLTAIVGPDWIKYSSTMPFMTNEELDMTTPGWRVYKFHDAEGNAGIRERSRPPLDLSLDLASMCIPIQTWDNFNADFGVLVEGPYYPTEEALSLKQQYSIDEIEDMLAGRREWPDKKKN